MQEIVIATLKTFSGGFKGTLNRLPSFFIPGGIAVRTEPTRTIGALFFYFKLKFSPIRLS